MPSGSIPSFFDQKGTKRGVGEILDEFIFLKREGKG